jgi:hypothetical protein
MFPCLTDEATINSMAIVPCHPKPGGAKGGKQSGGSCSLDGMQAELSISPEEHGELSHVSCLHCRRVHFRVTDATPWHGLECAWLAVSRDSLLRRSDRWWPPEATKEREKREGKRNVSSSSVFFVGKNKKISLCRMLRVLVC